MCLGGPPVLDAFDGTKRLEDTRGFGGDADAMKNVGHFKSPFLVTVFVWTLLRSYFFSESFRTIEPVSSSDFRLEMIFGQPPDTAPISFEG